MASLTHFEMEQALRQSGVTVPPYPTAPAAPHEKDLRAEDRRLIALGTAWERELERLYALHVQEQHLSTQKDFARQFDALCVEGGMRVALKLLNEDVPHRYTGFYQATPAAMVNVGLADKKGEPRPPFLAEVPVGSSFCQFVLRDGSFLTRDSRMDDRLTGHPYKGVMLAYCGVPVFDVRGSPVGTLCHFDTLSHDVEDAQVARLHAAAGTLTRHLALKEA